MTKAMYMRLCAGAVLAATTTAHAGVVPFDTGRFIASTGDVYSGLFSAQVVVDTITIGQSTFRAPLDELIQVASVRVYVDTDGSGNYKLLSDEQIASGEHGVSFGIARDAERKDYATTLEVMQGLDLSSLLFTDGTARVRVDVTMTVALRDSHPGQDDASPEVLLIGSFGEHDVRIAAMTDGTVDRPILVSPSALVDRANFYMARTGLSMLIDRTDEPQPISIVGFDLYGLGITDDREVKGYRLEIESGESAVFNIFGVGKDEQRTGGLFLTRGDDDIFELGAVRSWLNASTSGGSPGLSFAGPGAGGNVGGGGGFSGGGGGGGGGGGFPVFDPPDPDDDPIDPGDDNGNGNGGDNGGDTPPIPTPGTLALLALSSLLGRSRRRRA